MPKVVLVKTPTCPYCPEASRILKELKKEVSFEYEEIDATTPKGQEIVQKYSIMAVPTILINGKVWYVGVPKRDELKRAIQKA